MKLFTTGEKFIWLHFETKMWIFLHFHTNWIINLACLSSQKRGFLNDCVAPVKGEASNENKKINLVSPRPKQMLSQPNLEKVIHTAPPLCPQPTWEDTTDLVSEFFEISSQIPLLKPCCTWIHLICLAVFYSLTSTVESWLLDSAV